MCEFLGFPSFKNYWDQNDLKLICVNLATEWRNSERAFTDFFRANLCIVENPLTRKVGKRKSTDISAQHFSERKTTGCHLQ